jgi:quercetin dioxygenase-like cupin family protein
MRVIKKGEGQIKRGTTFKGEVILESMLVAQQQEGIQLSIVHFEKGAVTNWHEHPGEQILYILEGIGRVGNNETEWEVQPGDIVYSGPGEKHWHGATSDSSMSHISVTTVGPPKWDDVAPD